MINKKNGSKFITLSQFINGFYPSRFNRDSLYDLEDGEDINHSLKHRLYNKGDLKEVIELMAQYFEWVINAENVSKVYLTDNITLVRNPKYPRIKYATDIDVKILGEDKCKAGEYYITDGNYEWSMWLTGDAYKEMQALREKDPEFIQIKKELKTELEEKNKNAKPKD